MIITWFSDMEPKLLLLCLSSLSIIFGFPENSNFAYNTPCDLFVCMLILYIVIKKYKIHLYKVLIFFLHFSPQKHLINLHRIEQSNKISWKSIFKLLINYYCILKFRHHSPASYNFNLKYFLLVIIHITTMIYLYYIKLVKYNETTSSHLGLTPGIVHLFVFSSWSSYLI